MVTQSFHLRTENTPTLVMYNGEIVGYGENTILVEYNPEGADPDHDETFMLVRKESVVDNQAWETVFEGDVHNILRQIGEVIEPPPVELPPEETEVRHKPPTRSKSELDR